MNKSLCVQNKLFTKSVHLQQIAPAPEKNGTKNKNRNSWKKNKESVRFAGCGAVRCGIASRDAPHRTAPAHTGGVWLQSFFFTVSMQYNGIRQYYGVLALKVFGCPLENTVLNTMV